MSNDVHREFHRRSGLPWGSILCGRCVETHDQVGRVELGSGRAGVVGTWQPPPELVDESTVLVTVDDVDGVPMPPAAARQLAALLLAAAERADLAGEQLRL